MKILIATPSYEGKLDLCFVVSLLQTIDLVRSHGHQVAFFCQPGALVERARNAVCQKAIDLDVDYVWMIDDDTGWDTFASSTMLALMEEGEKFIAGAPPRRSYPIRFTVRLEEGEPTYVAGCRIKTCITAPVAFACIHRGVFEAIKDSCPEYVDTERKFRLYFEQRRMQVADGRLRLLGEDECFAMLARKAGIEIVCPLDMKLTHRGAHEFVASLGEEWDAQEKRNRDGLPL